MSIKFAGDNDKQAIIDIWRTCFNEVSENFLKLYFSNKYKKDNTLVYIKDNNVVATLQMLPYEMSFWGHTLNVSYIYGAATLPQYQKKGIMGELLLYAHGYMKEHNIQVSMLIPANRKLIDYYSKYGYSEIFEQSHGVLNNCDNYDCYSRNIDKRHNHSNVTGGNISIIMKSENSLESVKIVSNEKRFSNYEYLSNELYNYYRRKFEGMNYHVYKNLEDFRTIIEENVIDGGNVILHHVDENIDGLCFVSSEDIENDNISGNIIKISELLSDNEDIRCELVRSCREQYCVANIYYTTFNDGRNSFIYKGMAQIIDKQTVLHYYEGTNKSKLIEIKCSSDIRDFTKIVFCDGHPYLSLDLD